MSYKKATYISLLLVIGISILFYISSMNFQLSTNQRVGPGVFPQILSVLLIVFCIISFFSTRKQSDQEVKLTGLGKIIFTIILTILFIVVWQNVGWFYLASFIFLSILIYFYNSANHSYKKVLKTLGTSLLISIIAYAIFGILLNSQL